MTAAEIREAAAKVAEDLAAELSRLQGSGDRRVQIGSHLETCATIAAGIRAIPIDVVSPQTTTAHTEALEDARRLMEISRRWKANEMSGTEYANALRPFLGDAATLAFARALVAHADSSREAWLNRDRIAPRPRRPTLTMSAAGEKAAVEIPRTGVQGE